MARFLPPKKLTTIFTAINNIEQNTNKQVLRRIKLMKKNLPVSEQLKLKYHKTEEVSNFKEMLYRSADIYRSRTAFKVKEKDGTIRFYYLRTI